MAEVSIDNSGNGEENTTNDRAESSETTSLLSIVVHNGTGNHETDGEDNTGQISQFFERKGLVIAGSSGTGAAGLFGIGAYFLFSATAAISIAVACAAFFLAFVVVLGISGCIAEHSRCSDALTLTW